MKIIKRANNFEATFVPSHHLYTEITLFKDTDGYGVISRVEPIGFSHDSDVTCIRFKDVAERIFDARCKRLECE